MFTVDPPKKIDNSNQLFMTTSLLAFHTLYNTNEVLVTLHNVRNGNVGKGRTVSNIAAQQTLSALTKNDSFNLDDCILDQRILVNSDSILVWHEKSLKRDMWFRFNGDLTLIPVTYPSLVFVLNKARSSLYVYAKSTNKRPNEKTKLYVAPIGNISLNGAVCQGSAKLPNLQTSINKLIKECSDTIYNSAFSHVNNLKTFRGGDFSTTKHIAKWKELSSLNAKPKASEMTPFMSFAKAISTIIGG